MCLPQGHNAVMQVRLAGPTRQSQVKHSTTKPLQSLSCISQRPRSILIFIDPGLGCLRFYHGMENLILLMLWSPCEIAS